MRVMRTVRFPRTLYRALAAAAAENGHSINAEIVQRLRASFEYGRGLL
jgi:predicted HicB family RNase H-like nuclease